jgi:ubiquinone/menaquinone biosynthesis C-methylase UbiE
MYAQIVGRAEERIRPPLAIGRHFSRIASIYRRLRTTDSEPVSIIANKLKGMAKIDAVDVGCGAGRYDLLLLKYLGDKLRLTCLDANAEMLQELDNYLAKKNIRNFTTICSQAERLPFPANAMDCVATFNAVHHFNLPGFLGDSARIIKSGGYLFIYTRLREQNKRNIWGKYFPHFRQKETRLYTMEALQDSVESIPDLAVEAIVSFAYHRRSNISQLVQRARAHHYSTFYFYSPEEMEEAIRVFSQNITNHFGDTQHIHWFDENVLFIIRKR